MTHGIPWHLQAGDNLHVRRHRGQLRLIRGEPETDVAEFVAALQGLLQPVEPTLGLWITWVL